MSTKISVSILLAACVAASPLMVIANDNFPRHDDPSSVDSVVVSAIESVQIGKRALIDFGTYDEKDDPAAGLIARISGRGYNMQRNTTPGITPMYSMVYITSLVKRIENEVVRTFKEKRAVHCIATEDEGYVAVPDTDDQQAATFCRSRPDWKRYKAEALGSGSKTEVGATAQ